MSCAVNPQQWQTLSGRPAAVEGIGVTGLVLLAADKCAGAA